MAAVVGAAARSPPLYQWGRRSGGGLGVLRPDGGACRRHRDRNSYRQSATHQVLHTRRWLNLETCLFFAALTL